MAILVETNELPTAANSFRPFDDACSLILNQLRDDLNLRESETPPPVNIVESRLQPTRRDVGPAKNCSLIHQSNERMLRDA
jgi:hypothetical protein